MLKSKTEIGQRDERIVIQEGTSSTDEYNSQTITWSTFATVYAKVVDSSAGSTERYESDQLTAVRTTTFNIRYLSGVKEKMRILYDDRFYDIEFIGRPDRKRSLELRCILLDET
jgi:SPP1 family predicted phage head-tail adaptor